VLTEGVTAALAAFGTLFFGVLLAVVSASEQSFLSLTEAQLKRLRDRANGRTERIIEFVRAPHQVVITTILSSGVFVAGALACFLELVATVFMLDIGRTVVWALPMGLVLAVVGRALPRAVVSAHPERSAFHLVDVYSVVEAIFRPLAWAVRGLLDRVSDEAQEDLVAAEEFKAVAEEDEQTPRLQDEKRELIHSIFELGGTTSKEVMVPRIDMIMAEVSTSTREVLKLISEHGHSRIPIYDGSVDEILGVVHVKQIVRDGQIQGDETPVREFVRPVMFVPETKKIDELLQEFREKKSHLAIVVDEYGGTSGMVTLEDVLEEIVGEIQDEYDIEEKLLEPLADGSYRVAAKIDIDDLNEEMNLNLPTENSDTLGGFIYELVGKVPSQGEAVDYQGLRFIIDRVHGQRIVRVRIRKQQEVRT
jgi:CBS domain containing-hemolysin-like protein